MGIGITNRAFGNDMEVRMCESCGCVPEWTPEFKDAKRCPVCGGELKAHKAIPYPKGFWK